MSRSSSSTNLQAYTSRRSLSHLSAISSKSQPTTFVIEIGTRLTRIGIAGENAPRHVFRTQIVDPTRPSRLSVFYDPSRDPDEQERLMITFFKELVLGKMIKSFANSRFIIVDSLFSTIEFRNMCAQVLFKTKVLDAFAVSFVPGPLMHLVAMNADVALLVDTGVNECLLYPIFDRVVLYQEFDATPCSTAAVERKIRELMTEHGKVMTADESERSMTENDLKLFDALDCAEDICYRFCFATTRDRSIKFQQKGDLRHAPSVRIPFGSEVLVVPGIVRETAAEAVFSLGQELRSIPELLVGFINTVSIDMKRTFLGNLMFVGGLSNMQGFLARMREELEFLLDNYENGKYSKMKNDIGFHVNPDPSSTRFSTAWVGASLASSFDYNQWFTKQDWTEKKQVPDWTLDINEYLSKMEQENIRIYTEHPTGLSF